MATRTYHFMLNDLSSTEALGRALGAALGPGDQLALVGGLGAGKTTLSRFVAQGFGVTDLSAVASPTYGYAHSYPSPRGLLHHLDFYRLAGAEAASELGLDEMLQDTTAAALIEWADICPTLVTPSGWWLTLRREPGQEQRTATLVLAGATRQEVDSQLPAFVTAGGPA